jgi:hypothetical protein
MPRRSSRWIVFAVFLAGLSAGLPAKPKGGVDPSAWAGREPAAAAAALMELAGAQAGNGSWERIAVGRVHYLAGDKQQGEATFAGLSGSGADPSDLIRIVRVYMTAGEWDKARPLAERVLELAPDDQDWMVEIGAYFNLNGDRQRAEELFAAGMAKKVGLANLLDAAGSYRGVLPNKK